MATWIKAGFWEKLCKPCKGYKGWLNLDELIQSLAPPPPEPAYRVYTALLTQNTGIVQTFVFDGTSPGPSLVIGTVYTITLIGPNVDFTLVGAPNNNLGTTFIATGTFAGLGNAGSPSELTWDERAPIPTILENTLGGTPIWTRASAGTYLCTLPSAFPDNKTFCTVTYGPNNGIVPLIPYFGDFSTGNSNTLVLAFLDPSGAAIDPNNYAGKDIYVEIRVYP